MKTSADGIFNTAVVLPMKLNFLTTNGHTSQTKSQDLQITENGSAHHNSNSNHSRSSNSHKLCVETIEEEYGYYYRSYAHLHSAIGDTAHAKSTEESLNTSRYVYNGTFASHNANGTNGSHMGNGHATTDTDSMSNGHVEQNGNANVAVFTVGNVIQHRQVTKKAANKSVKRKSKGK